MGFMSAIVGIGSALIGARSASKQASAQAAANDKAIEASLMGFNYLKDNELVNDTQTQGGFAGQQLGGLLGLTEGGSTGGMYGALLGLGGDQAAADEAFGRFRDSTGYQFRMDQGVNSITGSNAARGLLNSGSTVQALNDYGQGMASQEFGNYLGQFQNLLGQLGAAQATGLNSAFQVASSGSSGGANAANVGMTGAARINDIRQQGTNNVVAGLGAAAGGLTDWWQNRQRAA